MVTWTISKSFPFDAAHFLPNVMPGHKCRNLHGHTYMLIVLLTASKLGTHFRDGMILDYGEVAQVVQPVVDELDHTPSGKGLNGIKGLENPTTEVLCEWFHRRLAPSFPGIKLRIEVRESSTTSCVYESES